MKVNKSDDTSLFNDPDFKRVKKHVTRWVVIGGLTSLLLTMACIMAVIWAVKHL